MGLLAWIGQGCKWLFKLVALPFARLGTPAVRPYMRWTIHVVCVLAATLCLLFLNVALDLDKVVRAPLPLLRTLWLPLLFIMVYTLAWLAWWCWKTATSPADASRFPALDEAWNEALRAVEEANIDLQRTPIYFVLGRSAVEDSFFQATGVAWDVPLAPRRSDAPLRLCATQDAIFISLASASATSVFAAR